MQGHSSADQAHYLHDVPQEHFDVQQVLQEHFNVHYVQQEHVVVQQVQLVLTL